MSSIGFRYALVGSVLTLLLAPAAHAQWAVIDVGAITQLIEEVSTLKQELDTAQQNLAQAQGAYQSITGTRGMERLLSGTNRNYLPNDWQSLQGLLSGAAASFGSLAGQLRAAVQTNAILTASQLAQLSPQERAQLQSARNSAAALQVSSQQALDAASQRFSSLQQLINALPAAGDEKAVLDLQARIAAEQTMLQNENTKLMVLYHAAQADELTRTQQAKELSIANHGSLRTLPPMGLAR